MESDGGSSASRRSGGEANGDRSSSSTQGFFVAKVGNERDGVAPKCHCGVYAVLYLSKTPTNPNRLFFGCPYFKIQLRHCKFFLWLDQHTAKYGRAAELKDVKQEKDDVEEHFFRMNIESRLSDMEDRITSIEKKTSINWGLICVCLFVMLIGVYVGGHKRVV